MRRPSFVLLRRALPLVVVAWLFAVPAFAEPVAVIASVKGRVDVTPARTRAALRAVFGRALEQGDKVTVGAGGKATVFFNDGNIIELAERSSITIGGRLAAGARGNALPGDVYAQVSRFATTGSRQTGLVAMAEMRSGSDESAPLLIAPRQTSILSGKPELSWRPVKGATRYHVRVSAPEGTELWSRDVPAAAEASGKLALPWPDDAAGLAAETEVHWEVEALDERGTLRREGTNVRVLAPAASADVHANLARIAEGAGGVQSPAARFLSGSYLSGLGLYQDASEEFRALARLVPDSAGPREALGSTYLRLGLVDLAAAEFQQALALQRSGR